MKKLQTTPPELDLDPTPMHTFPEPKDNSIDEEHSPQGDENMAPEDNDSTQLGSKKIRKKRETYQKIDDDVRVKLLEAVQQHGETLKSAAKRYNINYSSAKSILHTYRKEGRILKKSGQEKAGEGGPTDAPSVPGIQNVPPRQSFHIPQKSSANLDLSKVEAGISPKSAIQNLGISPTNIVDNFKNIFKLSGGAFPLDENMLLKGGNSNFLSLLSNKLLTPEMTQLVNNSNAGSKPNLFGMNLSPANSASLNQILQSNPLENLKLLDNFCMNYGNSPGTGQEKTEKDGIETSIKNAVGNENEAYNEQAGNVQQGNARQQDEIAVPHPLRFNTAQLLQNKIESKLGTDDSDLSTTIENAALDTFKSFIDAQFLLNDALKKASYLNSLVQMQRSKVDEASKEQAQGIRNT